MLELIEKPLINTGRSDLISRIGNTPLFRIPNIASGIPSGVEVLVKAEHLNPGGSVKDRAALNIINEARQSLEGGKALLDVQAATLESRTQ